MKVNIPLLVVVLVGIGIIPFIALVFGPVFIAVWAFAPDRANTVVLPARR